MLRMTHMLPALLAVVAAPLLHAGGDEKSRDSAERRLHKIETRAKKIPKPADADEIPSFLLRETQRLIDQSRTFPHSSYKFDRTLEAVDDLLDAREDWTAARQDREEDETRADTVKRLERAYFRVQQGEYFAKLSQDRNASEYVRRSRQLYQQARAAYDRRELHRANKLASASSELVNVLENLAQAAVRRPEPPVLK